MNDKLEFYYMLSDDEYIISYENALVKISRKSNDIVKKLAFNAQILKCCMSRDKKNLLVVCGNVGTLSSVLNTYLVNLEEFSVKDNFAHNIEAPGYMKDGGCYAFAYRDDFTLVISCTVGEFNNEQHYFYSISKDECEIISVIKSFLPCSFGMVAEKYILIRQGVGTIKVFDLDELRVVSKKKKVIFAIL
jgi:hypothetical protein